MTKTTNITPKTALETHQARFVWLPPVFYTCMYNIITGWCCYAYQGLARGQGENWEALSMIDTALLSKKEGYGLQRWTMVLVLALLFYVCYICHYINKANDSRLDVFMKHYILSYLFILRQWRNVQTQWRAWWLQAL